MPRWQIKSKPVPPPNKQLNDFVTDGDKARAEWLTSSGPYKIFRILIFVPTFYIVRQVLLPLVLTTGLNDQFAFFLWIAISVIIIWLVPKLIRASVIKSKLGKVVAERLHAEKERLQATHKTEQTLEMEIVTGAAFRAEMIYDAQAENLAMLDNLLEQTETSIDQAQIFFKERAYAPFWDSIENAVELLRRFDGQVSFINEKAKEYYSQLEGREHTFPAFP